jgi:hypothetical protein
MPDDVQTSDDPKGSSGISGNAEDPDEAMPSIGPVGTMLLELALEPDVPTGNRVGSFCAHNRVPY